jgi:hypothetical protein
MDPAHEGARRKLGHVCWEGRWFPSEEEMMKARGLVPFRGRWLRPEELGKESEGFKEHGGDWFTGPEWEKLSGGSAVETAGKPGWKTFRTLHYRLFTHLRPSKSLKFTRMAEQAYGAFERHFGFAPERILEGYIFEDLGEFEDFVVGLGFAEPGNLRSHGFFNGFSRKVYFPYVDDDYTTVNILLHELCHQFEFLSGHKGRVPVWFYEGIACVFGHHLLRGERLIPGRLMVKKNFNLYYFQHRVRTGGQWPLGKVLTGSPGPTVDRVFYNHAWALTWFLMHCTEGGYAEKFPAYQKAIHSESSAAADPVELFASHFGDLKKVEKDFYTYILSIKGLRWRGKGREAGEKGRKGR